MASLFTSGLTLRIELHSETIRAGGRLSGGVHLSVTKERVDATDLHLEVVGEESAVVHYTTTNTVRDSEGNTRSEEEDHFARSKRDLVRVRVLLASFAAGEVERGEHIFPFTADMPLHLPSSMHVTSTNDARSECEVAYRVHAKLSRSGVLSFDKSAQATLRLVAHPEAYGGAHPAAPRHVYSEPKAHRVKQCFCFPRGAMTLGARTDAHVRAGAELGVSVAAHNHSTAGAEYIELVLTEQTRWQSGSHSARGWSRVAQLQLDAREAAGLRSLESMRRVRAVQHDVVLRDVLEKLHAERPLVLSVPRGAGPSYQGSLLTRAHSLAVRVHTPGCCVTDPEAEMAVLLLPPELDAAELDNASTGLPPRYPEPTPPVVVPMSGAALGGRPVHGLPAEADAPPPSAPPMPPPPAYRESYAESLRQQLECTVDQSAVIAGVRAELQRDAGAAAAAQLGPQPFARLVGCVQGSALQLELADALAGGLGGAFTCAHVLAALRVLQARHAGVGRVELVQRLAHRCADEARNAELVASELSRFEQLLCEQAGLPAPYNGLRAQPSAAPSAQPLRQPLMAPASAPRPGPQPTL